jgi:hypothetical protein
VSTVKRTFASSPARDANATWQAIVDLLAPNSGADRDELQSVAGPAASIIADAAPETAPIVVTCDGPRTRIYCLYDEDAVEGSDVNEAALGFDALNGDWAVSLPCPAEDLTWISAALKSRSVRVTARDLKTGISLGEDSAAAAEPLVFNTSGFLGS